MSFDFKLLLSPERQAEIARQDEFYRNRLIEFRNMSKENLIRATKFFTGQMDTPGKYKPGVPVYDSTFWHLILPELLRRIGKNANKEYISRLK